MDKYTLKADKLFMKSFVAQKYPACTHAMALDMTFDYYNGLCTQFLANSKKLTHKVLELSEEEIKKIDEYINDNNTDNDSLIYYFMIKTAILILKRHYDEDGMIKY